MDEGLCARRTEPFAHLNIAPTIVLGSKRRRERRPEPRPPLPPHRSETQANRETLQVFAAPTRPPRPPLRGRRFRGGSVCSRQTVTRSLFLARKISLGGFMGSSDAMSALVADIAFPKLPPPPPHHHRAPSVNLQPSWVAL